MADVKIEAVAEVDDAVGGMKKLDKSLDTTDKKLDSVRDGFKKLDSELKVLKKDINNLPIRKAEALGIALRKSYDGAINSIREAGKWLKDAGAAAGIAAGIFYALGRGLDELAKRGEALGQRGLTKQWQGLKDQAQEFLDTLLTVQVAGKSVFDLLERFASGLTTVLKAAGVAVEFVAGGIDVLLLDFKRLASIVSGLTGGVDDYTQAMYEADRQQVIANHNIRIGTIWAGDLTEQYEKLAQSQKALRQGNIRHGTSLDELIKKNNTLNDSMSKRLAIEDAIRKGDPRAFMNALANMGGGDSGGGGVRGSGPLANGGGGVRGMNSGGGTEGFNVQVYIGNQQVNDYVEGVVVNGVKKSRYNKQANGASARKK